MQKRPDKLAAHILQPKFEVGMLINRVMSAVKRPRADVQPLLVGNFVRSDQMTGVAGPRRRDGRIERDAKTHCGE